MLSQKLTYLSDEDANMLLQLNHQIIKMLSSLIFKKTQDTEGNITSKPETSKPKNLT